MNYFSKLRIPEGRSGDFAVEHAFLKKGSDIATVSVRNAIFYAMALQTMGKPVPPAIDFAFQMGSGTASMTLKDRTRMHQLVSRSRRNDGGLWMSDRPQEVWQMQMAAKELHGCVLIGGLGLGLVLTQLDWRKVKAVDVVEKSQDVINLVWPWIEKFLKGRNVAVYCSCIKSNLRYCKEKDIRYDSAFFDVWCPTGQRVLTKWTMPLRRLCEGLIPNDSVHCWGELEMIGQVVSGINGHCVMLDSETTKLPFSEERLCSPEFKRATGASYEMYRYIHRWKRLNPKESAAEELQRWMGSYCETIMNPALMRRLRARMRRALKFEKSN